MTNGKPPRRRSAFGGLLLVLAGGLLLYQNFHPGFPFGQIFRQWWPVVLILWGVAKLYDHLMARRTGQAAPPTVTFGEVVLVLVLFSVVGVINISWDDNADWSWFGAGSHSFSEELPAKPVPADARILVRTDRGDISIHPEEAAEIRVVAKKTVNALGEIEAQRRANQVSVSVQQNGDSYEVVTVAGGGRVGVDLEVHVPKQATITAQTRRGGVQLTGVQGNVTVESQRGDVEVRDSGGDVSVSLARGDAHIVGAKGNVKLTGRGNQIEVADVKGDANVQGEFFGPIRLERIGKGARFVSRRTDLTVSGPAGRMQSDPGRWGIADVQGNLNLSTSKNDLVLENVIGRVHVDNRDGNVELRFVQPPREPVDITNRSGGIDIVFPAKSAFEIQASARSGEIDTDFEELSKQERQDGNNTTLNAKFGAKGPLFNLTTTYGTIRLRKGQ